MPDPSVREARRKEIAYYLALQPGDICLVESDRIIELVENLVWMAEERIRWSGLVQ